MPTTPQADPGRTISLITDLRLVDWGRRVIVEGLDDPIARNEIRFVFSDCRELHWSLYGDEFIGETEADVIGFCLGEDRHREPAVLTTDLFELAILYEAVDFPGLSAMADAVQPMVAR